MGICLINALCISWQHALYAPLGVEMCAGWKQVRVGDNNTIQRLGTGLPGSGAI